jgi:antitoxin (DNA-binding transcriptional repressor) of toxin-antitoxin stability system
MTSYASAVARAIIRRELRNASGQIMRALDRGESFIVARNGMPVGELTPAHSRRFVAADVAVAAFAGARRSSRSGSEPTWTPCSTETRRRVPEAPHDRGIVDTSVVVQLE